MPKYKLDLKREDIYLLTGKHAMSSAEFSPLDLLKKHLEINGIEAAGSMGLVIDDPDTSIGLMVLIEKLPFIDCSIEHQTGALDYGKNDVAEHTRILTEIIGEEPDIPAEIGGQRHQFLTILCAANQTLSFKVDINTSHPQIGRYKKTEENGHTGITVSIDLLLYLPGELTSVARFDVPVRMEPAKAPPAYDGVVSVDLGHTRSFMVCMEGAYLQGVPKNDPFDEVFLDPVETALDPTVISGIGVKDQGLDISGDGSYFRCNFEIGRTIENAEGLILGPKRMVVDPEQDKAHRIVRRDGELLEVPKKAPAELFLSKLVETFIRQKHALPAKLHVTYPTTFSLRETNELRRAFHDAWRIALGQRGPMPVGTRAEQRLRQQEMEKRVPDPIDEASAAASYLLYRDFVLGPGGIRSFMELYPRGLNVLVYDCGGGTTDIALVRARGKKKFDKDAKQETFQFHIENRARTGHRRFGGEEITLAIYRLLKIKLAHEVQKSFVEDAQMLTNLPGPPTGVDLANIDDLLPEQEEELNRFASAWIPTQWNLSEGDVYGCEGIVFDLWRVAELIKYELAKGKGGLVRLGLPEDDEEQVRSDHQSRWLGLSRELIAHLKKTHADRLSAGGVNVVVDWDRLTEDWDNIEIRKQELDGLIQSTVLDTVNKMNHLIDSKLGDKGEIGRVYVIGNGSRYPLVREMITKHVKVQFAEEKIQQEDIDTKRAVAKGACISAWLAENNVLVEWFADRELMKKLPHDITLGGLGGGMPEVLYDAGTPCDEMLTQKIPVNNLIRDNDALTSVTLYRRWPGDQEISKFLLFDFDRQLAGPTISLWFDTEEQKFFMQDDGGRNSKVEGKEVIEADYLPHVQSGRI